ncbi:SDR family oxidoreductase SCDLUD_005237 [Saccharomycodes ludwigii]|uniref:SDR family oxidoreductase n=1 Tax=Saccharomycodes ludwigii TaxID=36035 RepID=UPI001E8A77D4|nr:hypothetical protein SCDLUD_005237 [Saccharomycodes ludwigii]KAH3898895.1 hypothetical protein SCDLUD_005237 [Saccharomycodes ludwigii]
MPPKQEKETVLVSGASGFIAEHIIHQLLETNKYKIIGSVRTQNKADLLHKLFENTPDLSFVIVPDLSFPNAFDEAFIKIGDQLNYIFHTASPFFVFSENPEKDLLIPAINGTKAILEATVKYAFNVKKVIITSSYAAVTTPEIDATSGEIITEENWNPITLGEGLQNGIKGYFASKTFAEKAAWDFIKENNKVKFTLTTILPTLVLGEQLFDQNIIPGKTLNTSAELVNRLVHSNIDTPIDNEIYGAYISVQDVARSHLEVLFNNNLDGKRLLVSQGRYTLQTIIDIININFPTLRGKIAKGVRGTDTAKIASLATINNSVTKELLGFRFRNLESIIIGTVAQILKVIGK